MPHFAGLDVSKATTSICIVDEAGTTVREGVVETEPRAILHFLRGEHRRYRRVGIEAMATTPWIYERLAKAGLPVICIEARHAHSILKERRNKTDRNDARGVAELMRVGIYKTVHVKTLASQEAKLLLAARRLLMRKCRDVDNAARAMLLQFGFKVPRCSTRAFEKRAAIHAPKSPRLRQVVDALLKVHRTLEAQVRTFEQAIKELAAADPVCQRLMTAPGMGPLTVLAYRAAVDVPERFARSRDVGVHLGLTPSVHQSGTTRRQGGISYCGDEEARTSLYLAAQSLLQARARPSALKTWGQGLAASKGFKKAAVAVARRLAVILHRMWLDGTDFRAEVV